MESKNNLLGLHILLTLKTNNEEKLKNKNGFIDFANSILNKNKLLKVGESSHIFENFSFTAAICLMESHICIHTWPEINQLTADVYLCNYSSDNTNKVKNIASEIISYFEASIIKLIEIER